MTANGVQNPRDHFILSAAIIVKTKTQTIITQAKD